MLEIQFGKKNKRKKSYIKRCHCVPKSVLWNYLMKEIIIYQKWDLKVFDAIIQSSSWQCIFLRSGYWQVWSFMQFTWTRKVIKKKKWKKNLCQRNVGQCVWFFFFHFYWDFFDLMHKDAKSVFHLCPIKRLHELGDRLCWIKNISFLCIII